MQNRDINRKMPKRQTGYKKKYKSNKNDNKNKLLSNLTNGLLVGKVKKVGKKYLFFPRKIGSFYKSLEIDRNGYKSVKRDSLYTAHLAKNSEQKLLVRLQRELGRSGNLDIERNALSHEYNLDKGFPKPVESESMAINSTISESELTKRVDLRDKLIFTIDNDKARDYDDAVGIEKLRSGFRLWVSIADVSYYVKPGSYLDKEAYKRATSIYLTKSVVPMLPEKLSNDLCSLLPNKDRLTKTVEVIIEKTGIIKDYKIYNSVIRSKYRLNYSGVSGVLSKKKKLPPQQVELKKSLELMDELYKKLKKIRISSGYIDLNIPDPEIIEDSEGRIIDVVKLSRDTAHEIIEQLMVCANEVVATFINKNNHPSIYRIHESPEGESMVELNDQLRKLGYKKKIGTPLKAKDVQGILNYFKDKKQEISANLFLLRSMNRAIYTCNNKGHFGLGMKYYTHFTSPIRRYPDLIVHRVLDSLVNGLKAEYEKSRLASIGEHCSTRESFSDEVQRESIKLERVFLMRRYMGKVLDAMVISVKSFGLFVEFEKIFAEGFIPRRTIRRFNENKYYISQQVRVRVTEIDIDNRRVTLDLV